MAEFNDGRYNTWFPDNGEFKVPHHSKYKSIDGIWQLEYTRDKLAKYGLKDPWMRNEIWRYPKWAPTYAPMEGFVNCFFGRNLVGLKYGFLLFASVIITQNVYWRLRYGEKPIYRDDFIDWLKAYDKHRFLPNQ
ncbi:hypothetical protein ACFE04_021587 [Oxalis oulophora]